MTSPHSTEPAPLGLGLSHEIDRSLRVTHEGSELARYVYRPWDAQVEAPKPYFHPLRTLGGDVVSLYRPHDHVWHKGIAWSLPNVGSENFWGGPTYRRDHGYQWLPNDGTTAHRAFDRVDAGPDAVVVVERLDWITQDGEAWFTEQRSFRVTAQPELGAWTLVFDTAFTNRTGSTIRIGSPTTEGRENAGYGGLFWRGPRSFSGGRAYTADAVGGDDLMGVRAPWLAFAGRHDDHGRASTLVFVDAPGNAASPVTWFVRSGIYACVCPAPFFDEEVPAEPDAALSYRYAVVVADGDREQDGSAKLADVGLAELQQL